MNSTRFANLVAGLHQATGQRVVVIVDEYEKPVHDHLADHDTARRMRKLLASFYGTLKGCDEHLEKLFITGVGRMVKTSVFSSLKQIKDLTLHPAAATICGYTEVELRSRFGPHVQELAAANGMSEEQAWERLRERYNGYWWGAGHDRVYNPWAILNCTSDRRFDNWWWASGTPRTLISLAARLLLPEGDLDGQQVTDLSLLFDLDAPQTVPLLWQSGYLTITARTGQVFTLGFPNAEVREAWHAMLLDRFAPGGGTDGSSNAAVMLNALETGDRPAFERALAALFAAIPGELHVPAEAYYHSVFLAVLQAVGGIITPESRSWTGRADAILKTRDILYVIEFKLDSADEALAQIKARRYHEPYLAGPRRIVLLGAGGFKARAVACRWEDVRPT